MTHIFTILQYEKNCHSWIEHTIETIHSQGLEDIIDPAYLSVGGQAKDLFYEKQKCINQILLTVLQIDKGK